eukprot:TRINITY_DN11079_c0_g1_i1.p1 TRINITY_DN11079_c0_g1~~TRINITY_DN11079_c0_g1_i1.p1  ORF type:complete len:79 (-),score=3.61 TRINITY_DN11079_c0_g1_i1:202-438(-)
MEFLQNLLAVNVFFDVNNLSRGVHCVRTVLIRWHQYRPHKPHRPFECQKYILTKTSVKFTMRKILCDQPNLVVLQLAF